MKKLLSLFAAVGIMATTSATSVSCGTPKEKTTNDDGGDTGMDSVGTNIFAFMYDIQDEMDKSVQKYGDQPISIDEAIKRAADALTSKHTDIKIVSDKETLPTELEGIRGIGVYSYKEEYGRFTVTVKTYLNQDGVLVDKNDDGHTDVIQHSWVDMDHTSVEWMENLKGFTQTEIPVASSKANAFIWEGKTTTDFPTSSTSEINKEFVNVLTGTYTEFESTSSVDGSWAFDTEVNGVKYYTYVIKGVTNAFTLDISDSINLLFIILFFNSRY